VKVPTPKLEIVDSVDPPGLHKIEYGKDPPLIEALIEPLSTPHSGLVGVPTIDGTPELFNVTEAVASQQFTSVTVKS
jgi:hypothetical protein